MESQLTMRLSETLHRRLARAAKRFGRKRSDIARLALQRYLDEMEGTPRHRLYDEVRDLLGSLDSGVSDLASAHGENLLAHLRPDELRALRAKAKARKISLAALFCRVVREHLSAPKAMSPERFEAGMKIIGLGSSGRKDISERHDHYLGEALRREHTR